MIVCSCNVISDADVRSVVESPSPASAAQIYRRLGHRPRCGRCVGSIRKIVDDVAADAGCQDS